MKVYYWVYLNHVLMHLNENLRRISQPVYKFSPEPCIATSQMMIGQQYYKYKCTNTNYKLRIKMETLTGCCQFTGLEHKDVLMSHLIEWEHDVISHLDHF